MMSKINRKRSLLAVCFIILLSGFLYTIIGTSTRVAEIKQLVPQAMVERNWEILRYEGYRLGSMGNHGGKVWYHVRNTDDHSIQYRVCVTLWGGELHFIYGEPEKLNRINVEYGK